MLASTSPVVDCTTQVGEPRQARHVRSVTGCRQGGAERSLGSHLKRCVGRASDGLAGLFEGPPLLSLAGPETLTRLTRSGSIRAVSIGVPEGDAAPVHYRHWKYFLNMPVFAPERRLGPNSRPATLVARGTPRGEPHWDVGDIPAELRPIRLSNAAADRYPHPHRARSRGVLIARNSVLVDRLQGQLPALLTKPGPATP